MKLNKLVTSLAAAGLILGASQAFAVPTLQLGIQGGTYDPVTQTIIASSNPFELFAFLTPQPGDDVAALLADTYYISSAVIPQTGPTGATLGSFDFEGNTIDVTGDMTYGTAPLETVLTQQGFDSGDLAKHGIFETFFYETAFTFSALNTAGDGSGNPINTADDPDLSSLVIGDTSMFYASFTIDVANLDAAVDAIHFDLYNSSIVTCLKNPNCVPGDIDVDDFAPFSHDAQSSDDGSDGDVPGDIPEPATTALLGLGLLGLGLARRRVRR